jgi:hypothetical protein
MKISMALLKAVQQAADLCCSPGAAAAPCTVTVQVHHAAYAAKFGEAFAMISGVLIPVLQGGSAGSLATRMTACSTLQCICFCCCCVASGWRAGDAPAKAV